MDVLAMAIDDTLHSNVRQKYASLITQEFTSLNLSTHIASNNNKSYEQSIELLTLP